LWIKPREAEKIGEIDLDRNGKNDYDEHGKSWVNSTWKAGVDKVIAEINRLNNNRPLIINSGRFHEPEFYWEESNGMVLEMTAFIPQIDWFKNIYQSWMKKARQPHLLIMDGLGPDKEAYQHMRYLLGMTLFGDGYYCFSDNSLHHYHYYYDEFDTDLGQPTTDVQLIRPDGPNARGVYVRFFTKGAVIINASERNQVVSDADISSASGYNGPYFRFAGGQDPGFNSGGRFDNVQLSGRLNSKNRVIGDAILLTKQGGGGVADIVVDNNERGTNPGSQPATFSGNWTLDNDNNEDCWALSYRGRNGDWAVAYAPAGGGAATAKFTPTIGRAGKYHVYEWHGRILGRPAATNVPYEIRHTAGTTSGRINQSVGQGRWNYLGEFNFAKGKNNYVRISNDANGVVLADAFMFVYKEAMIADNQAPRAPRGIRVTQ